MNKTDFSFLNVRWTAGRFDDGLVEDDACRQFGVIDRAADLLDDPDIPEIDIISDRRVDDVQDRVDRNRRQQIRVLGNNLFFLHLSHLLWS